MVNPPLNQTLPCFPFCSRAVETRKKCHQLSKDRSTSLQAQGQGQGHIMSQ